MPIPRKRFLDRLVASRYKQDDVRKLLHERKVLRNRNTPDNKYLTGTHNGVFYRIRVPERKPLLKNLPKLRSPTSAPKEFKHVDTGASQAITAAERRQEFWESAWLWFRENYPTLILNFGSICTLIGFTRSDVLELRALSVTGSVCAVLYHVATPPVRITPILWSGTFAAVNSFKIFQIMQERKGSVNLTADQEERYINFFMPHGITPKQFQIIDEKATVLHVKKNELIIRKDEELNHVYLVVNGSTRASVLGRFLTAASTTPTAREERIGGASGAWIGEMSLLEKVWLKEQGKQQHIVAASKNRKAPSTPISSSVKSQEAETPVSTTTASRIATDKKEESAANDASLSSQQPLAKKKTPEKNINNSRRYLVGDEDVPKLKASRSMYTIVAQEDCTVLRWSHEDMEKLMERSTDMRAALTRAMTAAIVGKVINFTVSRQTGHASWSAWLDDWKHNAGARVQIAERQSSAEDDDDDDDDEDAPKESLPTYPIKRFR